MIIASATAAQRVGTDDGDASTASPAPIALVLIDDSRLVREGLTAMSDAKVIVMGLRQEDVDDCIRESSGFITSGVSFGEFFETILQVASGNRVLPKALNASLFALSPVDHDGVDAPRRRTPVRDTAQVTAREREVIEALSEGLSNKAIAARLNIAVHTVKSHVHNVLEKLALRSRLEVAAFSHASGRESAPVGHWPKEPAV